MQPTDTRVYICAGGFLGVKTGGNRGKSKYMSISLTYSWKGARRVLETQRPM